MATLLLSNCEGSHGCMAPDSSCSVVIMACELDPTRDEARFFENQKAVPIKRSTTSSPAAANGMISLILSLIGESESLTAGPAAAVLELKMGGQLET